MWPGLGAKHGPVVGRQGWQQHAVAIVEVASPRRVELPAVRPVSEACFCMWRRQKAARDIVPVGAVSPTFGDQKPSGCVRMGDHEAAMCCRQGRAHFKAMGEDQSLARRSRQPWPSWPQMAGSGKRMRARCNLHHFLPVSGHHCPPWAAQPEKFPTHICAIESKSRFVAAPRPHPQYIPLSRMLGTGMPYRGCMSQAKTFYCKPMSRNGRASLLQTHCF